jgi:hypothetical protein
MTGATLNKHSHRDTEPQRGSSHFDPMSLCLCVSVAVFRSRR